MRIVPSVTFSSDASKARQWSTSDDQGAARENAMDASMDAKR